MKIEQKRWTALRGWQTISEPLSDSAAQLVLVFGGRAQLENSDRFFEIKKMYPHARILLNTTSGEILDTRVTDDTLALTAVYFQKTSLHFSSVTMSECGDSHIAGLKLAEKLPADGLVHVFVISDGQMVNGTELINGMTAKLPPQVAITGGLAGDGANFSKTLVGIDAPPSEGNLVAVGFYGSHLKVGYGSFGGWDPFGPERLITKAEKNILYELDNHSALELYKLYLGDKADGLPGTALLFPLSIRTPDGSEAIVRTVLNISEEDQSMTFAGNMPKGTYARLMRANFDRLIEGATKAASISREPLGASEPELAILISCVGRKLVLDRQIEKEVDSVRSIFGRKTKLTGFYSYGEISPGFHAGRCELHNQTMTITTFREE
ncbi:MAG: FIST C-terminal domain-containing protein [Ignavibacteriales bacterium]|nr:hypothetical protein [Ignavibacteriaceae bacterium]QOJ29971.1 MAG: FIST C-terminal domain-containing protein [Ignavibacteriales bacterium]